MRCSGPPTRPPHVVYVQLAFKRPATASGEPNANKRPHMTKIAENSRNVRARPRSGRGGRRFKSCHSDQHLAEFQILTGTDCGTVSRVLLAFGLVNPSGRQRKRRVTAS